ncbi:MAG: hypothetical protein IKF07_07140 [Eubacterium sp.]|nr:hypothetical protein [Eubacterium sp.]
MKKKTWISVIALIVVLLIVPVMTACGSKAEEQPQAGPEQQEEEQPASTGPELTDSQKDSLLWQISDQEIELRYQEYIPDEEFANAEFFGIDREGDEGKAYVNLVQGEYVVVDGRAYNVSGSAGEAIIRFQYTDDQPKYLETIWSADGGDHEKWMEENFPESYLKKSEQFVANNDEGENVLFLEMEKAVEEEMGVPVEKDDLLEIDDEKGTYQILKVVETGDPADDTYKFDTEVIQEGMLEDLK